MLRALTIRFGLMAVGLAALDIGLNLVDAGRGLVGLSLLVYLSCGYAWIGLYCVAHKDEIPVRRRDPDPR